MMQKVATIIKALEDTSGTNDKIQILKDNKDNETLQKVLYYTYNPFMKYGISEKVLAPSSKITLSYFNIFELLDVLYKSNINDSLRCEVNNFLGNFSINEPEFELYQRMILKDLKINLGAKSINKIWKDLIPQFNVMLADKYFEKFKKVEGKEFIITTKLDGMRCVIINNNNNIEVYSRQGQLIEGLVEILEEAKSININTVLDGELLLRNDNGLHSKDLYRETMKEARKKGNKHNLVFNAFDYIPLEDFQKGHCDYPCSHRKASLSLLIIENQFKFIEFVPALYVGSDTSKIIEYLDIEIAKENEGVMVNILDSPYSCKRSSDILKVKKFQDADLRVLGVIEGTGKNKGKLGAITVQFEHEDKLYTCDCGSGFSDVERSLYYNDKDLLLDKIVTIGYFEVSQNSKTKEYSLRFPTWKGIIRNDKTEISMY